MTKLTTKQIDELTMWEAAQKIKEVAGEKVAEETFNKNFEDNNVTAVRIKLWEEMKERDLIA